MPDLKCLGRAYYSRLGAEQPASRTLSTTGGSMGLASLVEDRNRWQVASMFLAPLKTAPPQPSV